MKEERRRSERERERERERKRGGSRVARRYYLRGKLQSEKNYVGPAASPRQRCFMPQGSTRISRALAATANRLSGMFTSVQPRRGRNAPEITPSATLRRAYDHVHLSSLNAYVEQACLLALSENERTYS